MYFDDSQSVPLIFNIFAAPRCIGAEGRRLI